jgi:hypothetical protein
VRRLVVAASCTVPLLILIACAKQAATSREGRTAAAKPAAPPAAAAPAALRSLGEIQEAPAAAAPKMPRKLVRTVELDLTAAHTTQAADAAQKLAARLGGYVASMTAERNEDLMRYTITLRVPAEHLDTALAALKNLALRIDREQQTTDDVTDQYVDLDARLRTLRATEAELQALLAESRQRQRGAKEIMEIFRELTEIRTRIEQIHGQLAVFDKLSALSTINLRLTPPEAARPVAGEGWQPVATIRGSLRTLVDLLRGLGDFAIFAVIVLLPVALIVATLVYLLRRLWRRVRQRRQPAP